MESRCEVAIGKESFNNLKNKTIAVIGAGGTGNFVCQLLSKYPLKVTVFDGDFIEESNLERQVLFLETDVGKSKALVLGHFLAIDFVHDYICKENISELFKFDLVIDATDNMETRMLLNENLKGKVNWIHTAVVKNHGQLFFVKKEGPYIDKLVSNKKDLKCAEVGVRNSAVATIGAFAVNLAIDYLAKNKIEEKLIRIDLDSYEILKLKL